jgi:RNA polymerase sigma-70 factor (ECF subfamily)
MPDAREFVADTEQFRGELVAHCYRMLGSLADAEDLVQDTYLRAWRAYDRFEGRSSVRSWLYRIATNVCLTALRGRGRRGLPSGFGAPEPDPNAPLAPAPPDLSWLQPIPTSLVDPAAADPGAIVAAREGVRLALVASLQYLPPRQRAVLILRDVLAFSAAEVAELLDTSSTAVKSTLQRARARLHELSPTADDVTEPAEPELRAVLERYITAFENADTAALQQLLRADAILEGTPSPTWFAGRRTCIPYLRDRVLGSPGDWRLVPTSANAQPGAVGYYRDAAGEYRAFGVVVLTVTSAGIARITVFGDPALVTVFGHPPTLTPVARRV